MTLFFAKKAGSFSSQVYQGLQEEMIAYTIAESVPDNYNVSPLKLTPSFFCSSAQVIVFNTSIIIIIKKECPKSCRDWEGQAADIGSASCRSINSTWQVISSIQPFSTGAISEQAKSIDPEAKEIC